MEQIITASIEYSPETDVLVLWAEPAPTEWEVDPLDAMVWVYYAVDDQGRGTERIVAVEAIDFSKLPLEKISGLADLPVLWKLNGEKPSKTIDILKHLQSIMKARSEQAVGIA
ncbi:hypothetical protein SDD30_17210 [Moorella naiadis]|uniref:hypothetical protein n=1 Tax=Moorella naiadis (nom. illeg.) TaxID=3093670 RepID=UPI003D9C851C